MKEIHKSTQFKKDFKKIKNNQKKVDALFSIVKHLERGEPIPAEFSPHMLNGDLKGIMECHVESDLLLLWLDEENDIIRLLRIGSHAEVLGM